MKITLLVLGAAAMAVTLVPGGARADILTAFQFTGYAGTGGTAGNTNGVSAASVTAARVTATAYTANSTGFVAFGGGTAANYAFDSAGNTTGGTGTDRAFGTQSSSIPSTEALSISNATYYSFTLTPASGSALTLSSLTFDLRTRVNTGGTTPYTSNFALRTSLDGYAADVGTAATSTQTAVGGAAYVGQTISLSSLGTSGVLPANTAVTFRLYPFDSQNLSQDDVTVDNVTVLGTVPEPGTWVGVILAAAVAGTLRFLRRRRGPAAAVVAG